ncbi:hypothetical protein ACIBG8_54455 [Nonomuraea sp. NPDC050556]|uniref:hypothetical protein n=1 Tax=Nonomuraea sp. NPDC050556 TaxID=3364369 RepID=UPI0037B64569
MSRVWEVTKAVAKMINWQTLFSIRVWLTALIAAGLVAFLLSLLWGPLGYTFWLWLALVIFGVTVNPEFKTRCPYCEKRVKMGAKACHHCGRLVA